METFGNLWKLWATIYSNIWSHWIPRQRQVNLFIVPIKQSRYDPPLHSRLTSRYDERISAILSSSSASLVPLSKIEIRSLDNARTIFSFGGRRWDKSEDKRFHGLAHGLEAFSEKALNGSSNEIGENERRRISYFKWVT